VPSSSFRSMAIEASIALGCVKGISRKFLTLNPDSIPMAALLAMGFWCKFR
jgi:hypothetical protein